ncbi:MAG TPA: CdaR family protein [Candidatus Binataceae bacterium]|nr:CdaR family protein [Candidatus Binataceae bacterium]
MSSPALKDRTSLAPAETAPARVRRSYTPAALRDRLRRNMGLRVISLGLAIGLWIFVNAGQHESLKQFTVPIVYRGLPRGFVIANQHPEIVTIQVSGPRTLLSLIDPSRIALRIDLAGVTVGQASFKVGPDAFAVPRQTSVESILPSQIVLDIDRIVTRSVPVHLVTTGKVAEGYRLAVSEITPATITLKGPSKELARIEQVDTEPVDVSGLAASATNVIGLGLPAGRIKTDPEQVTARVSVAPVIGDREFRNLTIAVRDSDWRFRVEPTRAIVTVRGPQPDLAKLDLSNSVYVEADALTPGLHTLVVQVALPEGIELVRQLPAKVRVRLYKERRPTVEYQAQ